MTFTIEKNSKIKEQDIYLFTFRNDIGESIQITNFGGIVHSWFCKDKNGQIDDVLLGCKDVKDYQIRHPYFGAITGRFANRIAYGKFALDGKEYQLSTNLGQHHLHGGFYGLDQKVWNHSFESGVDKMILTLSAKSAHLEEGYPGNLTIKVVYTYSNENSLTIEYFAESDQATPINLTNHCYFNLSGNFESNILDHSVQIDANFITSFDESLIPTGEFTAVKGTVLDFIDSHLIGERILNDDPLLAFSKGYDHNFVLNKHLIEEPVATVFHIESGRRLKVFTDQPAVQLYTGNWLGDVSGKSGKYKDYSGLCLETQHFPDSPNHDHFPSTILYKNEKFYSKTTYKLDIIF